MLEIQDPPAGEATSLRQASDPNKPTALPTMKTGLKTPADGVRWTYLIAISLVHVGALAVLIPWLFSWSALVLTLVGVHIFGAGINLGYHRLLCHRSFATPRWVERILVYLGVCCMEDTPIKWVTTHRRHHQHSDKEEDPHTPLATVFWSHVGWLFWNNSSTHSLEAYGRYARDLVEDPHYRWFDRRFNWLKVYFVHALLFASVGAVVGAISGGPTESFRLALSYLVWAVLLRTVLVWHITWSVNSLAHVWGYRNYQTRDASTNNWFVALVTVGEGWHNNHHHSPTSASNQHRWWELDVSYWEIRLLQLCGLAWDVRLCTAAGKTGGQPSEPERVAV